MSETEHADNEAGVVAAIKKHRRWSPVWFLPILTFIVAMWLLWQTWLNQGLSVDVEFATGDGMVAGETQVRYKGIPVGVVKKLRPNEDADNVIANIQFQPEFRRLGLPDDTQFWLVQPQVSLQGVSGLNTLLTGNYLAIVPGVSDNNSEHFKALEQAPPLSASTPGLHLKLIASALHSISVGTAIYYREILIGNVQSYQLAADRQHVMMDVHIKPDYAALIHRDTRFWSASGVDMQASLSGIKVRTGSLMSMLFGGIAISESLAENNSPTAINGDQFELHPDYDSAQAGVVVRISFRNADHLQEGVTRVLYKGVEVGRLRRVILQEKQGRVIGEFGLDPRVATYLTDKTRFWLVKPELNLSNGLSLDAALKGGYLTFTPSDTGTASQEFVAQDGPAFLDFEAPGLHLILSSSMLNGLSPGAPVFFRDLRVGNIQSQRFDRKKNRMELHLLIDEDYAGLVNQKTRFWNLSGVHFNASLSGVEIRTGPLASLLSGGIGFDSPDDSRNEVIKNGSQYALYNSERDALRGFVANVQFASAEGLVAGSTKVLYRGIEIGRVDSVKASADFLTVQAEIGFVREAEHLLRDGTQFWLVKPELSLGGGGLDSLLSGAYISLRPGKGESRSQFTALKAVPPAGSGEPGLNLVLMAENSGGLSAGAPVLHKQIRVGSVQEVGLSDDRAQVQVRIQIHPDYAALVNNASHFWQAGGVQADLGLNGIEVRSASMAAVLQGGIAFDTPTGVQNQRAVVNGDQFRLYKDEAGSRWDGQQIVLNTDRVDGWRIGSEVRYRDVAVGQVIALSYGDGLNRLRMTAQLNKAASSFAVKDSQFFRVDGRVGLARNENVMAALTGPFIGVLPSVRSSADPVAEFDLLPRQPGVSSGVEGLSLVVRSDRVGGLNKGDPLLYRQVKVGEVQFTELATEGNAVLIHIVLWPEYQHLVRAGSRFWRASGVAVEAGLFSGVEVRSDDLETLLAGGVAFATPNETSADRHLQVVKSGAEFLLADEPEEDWLEWSPALKASDRETQILK